MSSSDAETSAPVKAFEKFWSEMTDDQNRTRTAFLQPRDVAALAFHSGVLWASERALQPMRSFAEMTDKSRVDRFGR